MGRRAGLSFAGVGQSDPPTAILAVPFVIVAALISDRGSIVLRSVLFSSKSDPGRPRR